MFGLQGPEAYVYTSRSGTLDVASINDVKDWEETLVRTPFVVERAVTDDTL
jgi:myosin-1